MGGGRSEGSYRVVRVEWSVGPRSLAAGKESGFGDQLKSGVLKRDED
jgi:hypothetical protein